MVGDCGEPQNDPDRTTANHSLSPGSDRCEEMEYEDAVDLNYKQFCLFNGADSEFVYEVVPFNNEADRTPVDSSPQSGSHSFIVPSKRAARRSLPFTEDHREWLVDKHGKFAGFSMQIIPRTPPSPELGFENFTPSDNDYGTIKSIHHTQRREAFTDPLNITMLDDMDSNDIEENSENEVEEEDGEDDAFYNSGEGEMRDDSNDFYVNEVDSDEVYECSEPSVNQGSRGLRKVDYESLQLDDNSLLISQKGFPLRHLNGHLYRFSHRLLTGEGWRCLTTGCKGKARLIDNSFELQEECTILELSREYEIEALIRINRGKALWVQGNITLRAVCDKVRKGASPEVLRHIPPPKILARRIRRMAEGSKSEDSYPFKCTGAEKWLTFNGKRILAFNDTSQVEQPNGIVIISSAFGKKAWEKGTGRLHFDGEMKRNPEYFVQTYNCGTVYEGCYVNCFTCFIGSREQNVYHKLFTVIRSMVDCTGLRSITMDFELGASNAAKMVFPACEVNYCSFHLKQSLLRQTKEYGFERDDPRFRLVVHLLTSLQYLNPEDIQPAFLDVLRYMETLDENVQEMLQEYVNYFATTYIGIKSVTGRWRRPRYPPETWSVYVRLMRDGQMTNNPSEVYNADFGKYCKDNHPTMFGYIKQLKLLWEHKRDIRAQGIANGEWPRPHAPIPLSQKAYNLKDRCMKERRSDQCWLDYLLQISPV